MIAVIGAGAMGSALAIVHNRAGMPTALLGTEFDEAAIEAGRSGRPHPALGITLEPSIDCRRHDDWSAVLGAASRVLFAVSSDGLADVVSLAMPHARRDVLWMAATKGWDADTLRTPSEVIVAAGARPGKIVILAGPALAPELVAGAPTAMVCASSDADSAREVSSTLIGAGVFAEVTDDVAGVEVAAAYKNVTAIAVGMCEGMSERVPERVFVHRFADARAAMFAHGLRDMDVLARPCGGRTETILGLAGAGDLYVTCLGGRNGNMGRLLGAGQTAEQARETIGSTVEGVANASAALALAERSGVRLRVAPAVAAVLSGRSTPETAIAETLGST